MAVSKTPPQEIGLTTAAVVIGLVILAVVGAYSLLLGPKPSSPTPPAAVRISLSR
ncbi:MAG: hypothetical protein IT204_01400 [Fimbriimonadaceae bacterium]|nr:hypothetical protein [Fimbriimonadaceae bacterium]